MHDSREIAAGSARGMETTEAGLVVPAGTIEKRRQRWTWDAWKKIDRGIKALAEGGGIMALFVCASCGKRLKAKLTTGRDFELECLCTVHEIKR